jgi:hypothetical protein
MSILKQVLQEMSTTSESAAYAKQLVRGEKYGPGILNKLDRWFMDAMFTKDKDRFIPAAGCPQTAKTSWI